MCTWLDKNDTKSIIIILEGLRNILAVGKHFFNNEFQKFVDECGGLDKLEVLQEYPNHHVYEIALEILENYFEIDEIDLNQATQPDTPQQMMFF